MNGPRRRPRTRGGRLLRALLRALPVGRRHHFGDDLVSTFEEAYERRWAEEGGLPALRYLFRTLGDVVGEGSAEWWRSRRPRADVGPLGREETPDRRRTTDRMATDLRNALRLLRRSPGFTVVTVLVLSLGVGASTAIFSVVDHILLRPLPLPDSERLVTLCEEHERLRGWCGVSMVQVADWSEAAPSFEAMGVGRSGSDYLEAGDASRWLSVGLASPGLLTTLGVQPVLGRLFREDDLLPDGDPRILLLGHALWQTEFGGDPEILGRTVRLSDESFTVVGVLPPEAEVPRLEWMEAWRPLRWDPTAAEHRDWRGFMGLGKLEEGVDIGTAEAELEAVQARLSEAYPEAVEGWGVGVQSLHDFVVGDTRPTLLVFLGAVAVVLVIVCVNVASLLLARTTSRARELAVRASLGAGSGRLGRQLLAESAFLGLLGGAGGVALAYGGVGAFLRLAPPSIPRLDEVAVDVRVLAFAVAVSLATGLLVGIVPALRLRGLDLARLLREGRGTSGSRRTVRTRRLLVVSQLALAVVLLAGSGLLLRSFGKLLAWEPGFDAEHVLALPVFLPAGAYPDEESVRTAYRRIRDELQAVPGIRAAGAGTTFPLRGFGDGASRLLFEGGAETLREDAPSAYWIDVGPGYFEALGITLLRGRTVEETDVAGAPPVAVINETMARLHWPGEDPIGELVRLPEIGDGGRRGRIVGIVGDVQPFRPGQAPEAEVYFSAYQYTRPVTFFLVRTQGEPTAVVAAGREALQRVEPSLDPSPLTVNDLVESRLVRPRFNLSLVGALALVALLLGAAGVYGVVAYLVGLRRHEIGIRKALGARPRNVVRSVVRDGLLMVALGVPLGLLGALAAGRFLSGMIYGVEPHDPRTLTATALVIGLVGVLGSLAPAVRASRVDPLEALQDD